MAAFTSSLLSYLTIVVFLSIIDGGYVLVKAFSPSASRLSSYSIISLNKRNAYHVFSLSIQLTALPNNDEDFPEDFYDDDDDEDDNEDGLDSLIGKKLGINIGAQLPTLSQEEIDDIRVAAQETLDKAIDGRLADIEELRSELQSELSASRSRMEKAAELNVAYEKQNLMERIDQLSNDFLNKDKDFRESTKRIANADKLSGSLGKGVDWGSWGNLGDGEVAVTSSSGDDRKSASKLLGSVDAARRRAVAAATIDMDDDEDVDSSVLVDIENRVLIVVDDKKDKSSGPMLDRLSSLLNDAFDSNIIIDTYSPYANIPIGGNNAQTAIIFASSINDRSSLESLLGRILKRTAPVAGGKAGMPPSHVVLISSLGTERTNKMPYSMSNLFGGKLDKIREIEQGLISISRSRTVGKQTPLDYTIVKFGDIIQQDNDNSDEIDIQPGDVLDGEISSNAAANVLIQAMAYQPYARNSTLCTTGSLPDDDSSVIIDDVTWNDKFLCLSGPELLRIEAGRGAEDADEGILDSKYEQLCQYVKQWSSTYEGDRKGTGLTTPVIVRKSRKPPSELDGVIARDGVRILFQTTNTGDRYKSAAEEKLDEKERNSGGAGGGTVKKVSSSKPIMTKAQKEGGVEILVEKTTDGNIRVRARRCNVDNKTIVKEMSEVVIVKSLKKAVEAWVKARDTTGF